MKRGILVIVAVLMATLLCGNAFAAKAGAGYKTAVDGMLSVASEPESGFGDTVGVGVGVSFDLSSTLKPSSGKIFGRADINYFSWDASEFGIDVTFTRVPIFLGGRYYIPTSGSNIDVFVEAGLEFSFDKAEAVVPAFPPFFGAVKSSESDFNIGITPGVGIEVPISNDGWYIGGDARWHIIENDYFTLSFVFGKRF